jgi:hypothetical protein
MLDENGAVSGMRIDRVDHNKLRKPAQVPHCPQKIPYDVDWDGNRAAEVGNMRARDWALVGLLFFTGTKTLCGS